METQQLETVELMAFSDQLRRNRQLLNIPSPAMPPIQNILLIAQGQVKNLAEAVAAGDLKQSDPAFQARLGEIQRLLSELQVP